MKDLIKLVLGITFIIGACLYADLIAESAAKLVCEVLFQHTRDVLVGSLQVAIAAIVGCCKQG